jgi:hypothetical protein
MMPERTQTAPFIDGLYGKLIEGAIGYFFPSAKFGLLEPDLDDGDHRIAQTSRGTSLILNWLGSRYSLRGTNLSLNRYSFAARLSCKKTPILVGDFVPVWRA